MEASIQQPTWPYKCVMPFGPTNAPAVFQALVNDVPRDILNKFLFIYINGILIFWESEEEHFEHGPETPAWKQLSRDPARV